MRELEKKIILGFSLGRSINWYNFSEGKYVTIYQKSEHVFIFDPSVPHLEIYSRKIIDSYKDLGKTTDNVDI